MKDINGTVPVATKILIVDDETDICYFLKRNFSRRGFNASISGTLAEAEKQIETSTPNLLLLDNHLPDGKGVDFAGKISVKYPGIIIIMLTAHDSPQDRAKAYDNGITFFLSKPFTMERINQAVDLML